jgi:hypothetical protein
MTEEQFKVLSELLKKILDKLEMLDEDVSSLSDCVESQLGSVRVYPVTYNIREDD